MTSERPEIHSVICNLHINMSTALGASRQESIDVKFRPNRTVRIQSQSSTSRNKPTRILIGIDQGTKDVFIVATVALILMDFAYVWVLALIRRQNRCF